MEQCNNVGFSSTRSDALKITFVYEMYRERIPDNMFLGNCTEILLLFVTSPTVNVDAIFESALCSLVLKILLIKRQRNMFLFDTSFRQRLHPRSADELLQKIY